MSRRAAGRACTLDHWKRAAHPHAVPRTAACCGAAGTPRPERDDGWRLPAWSALLPIPEG